MSAININCVITLTNSTRSVVAGGKILASEKFFWSKYFLPKIHNLRLEISPFFGGWNWASTSFQLEICSYNCCSPTTTTSCPQTLYPMIQYHWTTQTVEWYSTLHRCKTEWKWQQIETTWSICSCDVHLTTLLNGLPKRRRSTRNEPWSRKLLMTTDQSVSVAPQISSGHRSSLKGMSDERQSRPTFVGVVELPDKIGR